MSSLNTPRSLKTVKHWYNFVRMDNKTDEEYIYLCTYESLHKVYMPDLLTFNGVAQIKIY